MSDLVLQLGNKRLTGWKTANIRTSIYGVASGFNLSIIATDNDVKLIQGEECSIFYKGKLKVSGYIEKFNISETDEEITISIEGRSKLCDLVDSAVGIQKQFKDITVNQIIEKIVTKFGFKAEFKQSLNPKLKNFTIEPGETAFDIIERLAKASASLVLGLPDGTLLIIDDDFKTNNVPLRTGGNIISLDITQDLSNVFHKYTAFKQKTGLAGNTNETYSAIDKTIRSSRVLELMPKNGEDLQSLVEHTAKVRKAKSLVVECKVIDWDYSVAEKVKLFSKFITDTLIITDVNCNFTLDSDFTSQLTLCKEEGLLIRKESIEAKKGGLL